MRLKKFITITCILFSLVYNFAFASSNLTPEEQEIALLENNILALQQKLEVLKEQQRQKTINNNPKIALVHFNLLNFLFTLVLSGSVSFK